MVSPRAKAAARPANNGKQRQYYVDASPVDDRSTKEKNADWLMDRQIDIPLYTLLTIVIAHALSGTTSLSLPQLSTHLPHSLQTLLPGWARSLPILAPFATELPNASHDSKQAYSHIAEHFWSSTGYAGPFRSDAVGFGHPLTALHNFTRACLGLSYEVQDQAAAALRSSASYLTGDLRYGQSHQDSYPWNSWIKPASTQPSFLDKLNKRFSKGPRDAFFVLTGILLFTVLRAVVIRYALVPLGRALVSPPKTEAGASSHRARAAQAARAHRRTINRFSEQAWIAVWGTLSLALSLYVASREPYWTSELRLWTEYPYSQVSGLTKSYYLMQTAFWVQQVIVINVEARRKDHWQMFTHHVVTILLLLGSYWAHYTPIGNIVLILMDPCDILLALAKCLRYYGAQTACDVCFGLFMAGWIVTRHILYNRMLWSCIGVAREALPEVPGATKADYWGFRNPIGLALTGLLCVLQVILCVWLVMIVRVAWRVVTGQGAADTRSDDESDDNDEAEEEEKGRDVDTEITKKRTIATTNGTHHQTIAHKAAATIDATEDAVLIERQPGMQRLQ